MKQPLTTKELTLITGVAVGVVVVLILWLSTARLFPELALHLEELTGSQSNALLRFLDKTGHVVLSFF